MPIAEKECRKRKKTYHKIYNYTYIYYSFIMYFQKFTLFIFFFFLPIFALTQQDFLRQWHHLPLPRTRVLRHKQSHQKQFRPTHITEIKEYESYGYIKTASKNIFSISQASLQLSTIGRSFHMHFLSSINCIIKRTLRNLKNICKAALKQQLPLQKKTNK